MFLSIVHCCIGLVKNSQSITILLAHKEKPVKLDIKAQSLAFMLIKATTAYEYHINKHSFEEVQALHAR